MCSASQPSSRAIAEAIRSAKHFLPSSAFPPYPDPNDQISRVSGKCEMYFVSLQGHGTSSWPGASGAPTECTARTKNPSSPSCSSTGVPIRVMMRMEAATYGESEISTPSWAMGEPSGPMQNGMTYMVRPAMQPSNSPAKVARISSGAIQLFVGPASDSCSEQMNVRSSTRATSEGSERAAKLRGRRAGLSGTRVPCSTSSAVRLSYSSCEPSHHCTLAGRASATISLTHAFRPLWDVGDCASPVIRSLTLTPAPRGFLIS
jgi:hypothetical protein